MLKRSPLLVGIVLLLSLITTTCATKTFTIYTSSTVCISNCNGTAQAPFKLVNESISFSAEQIKAFHDKNKQETFFIVNYEIDSSSIFDNIDNEIWSLFLLRELSFDCSISVNFNCWKRIVTSTSKPYFTNQITLQAVKQQIIPNPFFVSLQITMNELKIFNFYSKDIIEILEHEKLLDDHLTITNCEFRKLFIQIDTLLTINVKSVSMIKKATTSCEDYSWTISSNSKINNTIQSEYNIDKLEINVQDVEFIETLGDNSCARTGFAIHSYNYNVTISNANIRQHNILLQGLDNILNISNTTIFGEIAIYHNRLIHIIDSTLVDTITILYPGNIKNESVRNVQIVNSNIFGKLDIDEYNPNTVVFTANILIEKCVFEGGSLKVQYTPTEMDHVIVNLKDLIFSNVTIEGFNFIINVEATEFNIDNCNLLNNRLVTPNFLAASNKITNVNNLYISNNIVYNSDVVLRFAVSNSITITNSIIELPIENKNVIGYATVKPSSYILSNVTYPKSYCFLNMYSPDHFWNCEPCYPIRGEIAPTNYEAICTRCPAGTYADSQYLQISQCVKCPPGTYSKANQTSNNCAQCRDQSYAAGEGNTECLQCSSDNTFVSNTTPCKQCNALQRAVDSSRSIRDSGAVCEYKPIVVTMLVLVPIIIALLFCGAVVFAIVMRNKLNNMNNVDRY